MRLLAIVVAVALAAPAIAQPGSKLPVGQWHGTGLQTGPSGVQSTWTIDLSLNGDRGGTISYPSLGCEGVLHRIASTSGVIAFREEITAGTCINDGRIAVTLENGRVFWFWTKPGVDADASAVLYPSNPIA